MRFGPELHQQRGGHVIRDADRDAHQEARGEQRDELEIIRNFY